MVYPIHPSVHSASIPTPCYTPSLWYTFRHSILSNTSSLSYVNFSTPTHPNTPSLKCVPQSCELLALLTGIVPHSISYSLTHVFKPILSSLLSFFPLPHPLLPPPNYCAIFFFLSISQSPFLPVCLSPIPNTSLPVSPCVAACLLARLPVYLFVCLSTVLPSYLSAFMI